MKVQDDFSSDIEKILSHRYDLGADYWTTPDVRLLKGSPYSAMECVSYLLELGMDLLDPLLQTVAALILGTWQEDGRFKLYPKGSIYPCQTIHATELLCRLGYARDHRVQKTLEHLIQIQQPDGGWRCNKFSYGHGPETEFSNPFPTLRALNAFRWTDMKGHEPSLDYAVDFLLNHWEIKQPIGPCHYGIGTLFMQVEYPFRNYNLFLYVYVLSFYERAWSDSRYLEALNALTSKTIEGQILVERVVSKLRELSFCEVGKPSLLATRRYHEIIQNGSTFGK